MKNINEKTPPYRTVFQNSKMYIFVFALNWSKYVEIIVLAMIKLLLFTYILPLLNVIDNYMLILIYHNMYMYKYGYIYWNCLGFFPHSCPPPILPKWASMGKDGVGPPPIHSGAPWWHLTKNGDISKCYFFCFLPILDTFLTKMLFELWKNITQGLRFSFSK